MARTPVPVTRTLHDPTVVAEDIAAVMGIKPAFALAPDEHDVTAFFSARRPGFGGLVQIILEQQVSVRAGQAMWRKLAERCDPVEPTPFLKLDDTDLKACGFSRQKITYARGAAQAILDGTLAIDALETIPEPEAMTALTALKGIGRWTAEIYLMSCLGRTDIWPSGDLALVLAIQHLEAMAQRPSLKQMDAYGERFAGRRSVASLMTWHYYRRHLRPKAF